MGRSNATLLSERSISARYLENFDVNKEYDVIIVGAGITGITTALQLQASHLSCLLVEANTIGVTNLCGMDGTRSPRVRSLTHAIWTTCGRYHARGVQKNIPQ